MRSEIIGYINNMYAARLYIVECIYISPNPAHASDFYRAMRKSHFLPRDGHLTRGVRFTSVITDDRSLPGKLYERFVQSSISR